MNPISIIVILLIVVLIVVLIFITLGISTTTQDSIINYNGNCTRATNQLIPVNNLPCCYSGGMPTPYKYITELNVVVSPSPTPYLAACSGFCANGLYNGEQCLTGDSDQFTKCINLAKPVQCTGTAMPVGISGTTYYYIKSATNDECQKTGSC